MIVRPFFFIIKMYVYFNLLTDCIVLSKITTLIIFCIIDYYHVNVILFYNSSLIYAFVLKSSSLVLVYRRSINCHSNCFYALPRIGKKILS